MHGKIIPNQEDFKSIFIAIYSHNNSTLQFAYIFITVKIH